MLGPAPALVSDVPPTSRGFFLALICIFILRFLYLCDMSTYVIDISIYIPREPGSGADSVQAKLNEGMPRFEKVRILDEPPAEWVASGSLRNLRFHNPDSIEKGNDGRGRFRYT